MQNKAFASWNFTYVVHYHISRACNDVWHYRILSKYWLNS